jgi:hypothetical protein
VTRAAKRQVALRLVLAGCAYLVVVAVGVLLFWRPGSSTVTVEHVVTGGGTYVTHMIQPGRSVYQENTGPVTVILLVLFAMATVATSSVVYRAVKRSSALGVTGMVVAVLACVFCVLAMLSVGPFALPLAALLVVLALPMNRLGETVG